MLDEPRNRRLMELFAEGVELSAEERAAFVDRAAGDDLELGSELAGLLQVEGRGLEGFLDEPVVARSRNFPSVLEGFEDPALEPRTPEIDGYRDFVLIGEGGMGVVYRAEQHSPVRRTVAIKLIRTGMDSRKALQRFEAERQALARMSHAHIATVHDAGTDREGRPFLVMEFIDGTPITDFCRTEQLSLDDRLELFAKVCDAVDHAHRRGVLHRDLKPSNALVELADGHPVPKVIDFGIAKAVEGDLTELTLVTEQGAFLGTPEYMSPEQLDGDAHGVDTRTDIYALGVILYELVTGTLPLDSEQLRTASYARRITTLRTESPPPPSRRLRASGTADGTTSQRTRGPERWAQRVRGDLDWITLKALDKDPEQRYSTPGELAAELRRFVQNQPVEAGPPSAIHRLRRFTRRYRIQVAAGVLLLLSLLVGLSGTLWFLFESKGMETEALQRAEQAVAAQRKATGSGLAATAALVTDDDPDLALQLALEATRHADEYTVAEAIYRALPGHDLEKVIQLGDHASRDVRFLDDGTLVARTHDLVLWHVDVDRGVVLHRLDGHTEVVVDMDVDPALGTLLSASDDGSVRVWSTRDGTCLGVLEQGTKARAVGFSPDRRMFAALAAGDVVRVYRSDSLALVHEFPGSHGTLQSFDFHPDGRHLLLHSLDGSGQIRDLEDGHLVRELHPPADPVPAVWSAARFGPRGERIVRTFGPQPGIDLLQVLTPAGALVATFPGYRLMAGPITDPLIAFSREHLHHVSLETGEIVGEVEIDGIALPLRTSPGGDRFLAVDERQDLVLCDLRGGEVLRSLAGRSDKRKSHLAVAFHPDGRRFAVTGMDVRVWSLDPEFRSLVLPVAWPYMPGYGAPSIAYVNDEAMALVHDGTSVDGPEWTLWSLDRRSELRRFQPPGVSELLLPESGTVLIGSDETGRQRRPDEPIRFTLFDPFGERLGERSVVAGGLETVIHPDGSSIAVVDPVGAGEQRVRMFEFATGRQISEFRTGRSRLRFPAGPAQRYVALSYGEEDRTDFLDPATGSLVRSFRGPRGASHYFEAIDPEARRVLIGQGNLRIRAYDLDGSASEPTGEYTRLVRSNSYATGFVPRSELAWARCANELHLFHSVTCRPFAVIRLDERISCVATSPDGSEILTVSERQVQRWPLDPVAVARRKVVGSLDEASLELFGIGTAEERDARERARWLASPSPRNMARLAEQALGDGDLDRAIESYRRACESRLLGEEDRHLYVRLVELICSRLAASEGDAPKEDDLEAATTALEHCRRCKVPLDALLSLSGIDALRSHPPARRWLDG